MHRHTIDWDAQEFVEVRPGIRGATVHTPQLTATLYRYSPGSSWENHAHPQDQMTFVIEGEIDFIVDGKPVRLRPVSLRRCPAACRTRRRCRRRAGPSASTSSRIASGRRMVDADWLALAGRRVLVAGGAGTLGRALVGAS